MQDYVQVRSMGIPTLNDNYSWGISGYMIYNTLVGKRHFGKKIRHVTCSYMQNPLRNLNP